MRCRVISRFQACSPDVSYEFAIARGGEFCLLDGSAILPRMFSVLVPVVRGVALVHNVLGVLEWMYLSRFAFDLRSFEAP